MKTAIATRTVTDPSTGESLALVPVDQADAFSMAQYLETVISAPAVSNQKALATAYDTLVGALIGDNDVQVDGGRSFKKKSAWLKLGRAFKLDTTVVSTTFVDVPVTGSLYEDERTVTVCQVVVEARAPWGQVCQAIGGCGYDEETPTVHQTDAGGALLFWPSGDPKVRKGKELSLADMMATAQTRATNRAISTLIALGEVSAEEMDKGRKYQATPAGQGAGSSSSAGGDVPDADAPLTFGIHKGKTWREVAAAAPDYLEYLLKAEAKKPDGEKYKKSPAWVAFVEGLLAPQAAPEGLERAGEGEDLGAAFAAFTPGQVAYARQLSSASALPPAVRAWALEKLELATAEGNPDGWTITKMSALIVKLEETIHEREAHARAERSAAAGEKGATAEAPAAGSMPGSDERLGELLDAEDDDLPF
jgi:hypothetical protein